MSILVSIKVIIVIIGQPWRTRGDCQIHTDSFCLLSTMPSLSASTKKIHSLWDAQQLQRTHGGCCQTRTNDVHNMDSIFIITNNIMVITTSRCFSTTFVDINSDFVIINPRCYATLENPWGTQIHTNDVYTHQHKQHCQHSQYHSHHHLKVLGNPRESMGVARLASSRRDKTCHADLECREENHSRQQKFALRWIFLKEIRVFSTIHLSPLVPSLRLSDVQGATAVALEFSQFSINLSKV